MSYNAAGDNARGAQTRGSKIMTTMKDFIILTKIGDGAYSEVYKVKRNSDGQIYALKKVKMGKLSVKEKENALNEVRILASFQHASIVGYKEAFFEDSTSCLCIVMDYLDDGDLYQKIVKYQKANRMIGEVTIWKIFIEMIKALRALHNQNILHRDLKSANVFLQKNGNAKLGDLNVSKVAKKGLLYTQTGTPYYASPEVWKDQPYGSKSDIWSLGCVLYEMCSLKPPFRANDMNGLYKRVLKGSYPPIDRQYSQELIKLLQDMLRVDPKLRPSCSEIIESENVISKCNELEISLADEPITMTGGNSQGERNSQGSRQEDRNLEEELSGEALLKTIKVPANLANLSSRLPKSNYQKTRGDDISLASLRNREPHTKTSSNRNSQSLAEETRGERSQLLPAQEVSKGKQSLAALNDIQKHNEYDNRLNSGATNAPRGLPPRGLAQLSNARSMKVLDGARGSQASGSNANVPYNNKISILQKPGVRASQNLPPKYDQAMGQYNSKNAAASTPLSPQIEGDKQSNASGIRRNVIGQRGSNRSSSNTGVNVNNKAGDALERQIQAELNHRRLNENQKRLGSDFLNDLKLPSVDSQSRPGNEIGVNSRGQNVINRQRDNLAQIQARERNEQKRLLSRQKNRASEADKMSRGRGYEHYRSDNHLPEADQYSKNGGMSLEAGSNQALRSNVGGGARNRLEALESERKNLALIKGNGQHGSYGGGQGGSRGQYERSHDNRNYMKQNMTPAQLRMEAAQNSLSNRSGPNHHINSLPPTGSNPTQRLIGNQYQQNSASMAQPQGHAANYRNQYHANSLSYQNQINGQAPSSKGSSGPIISTHNRHGLIEVNNRRGNYPANSAQNGANWW